MRFLAGLPLLVFTFSSRVFSHDIDGIPFVKPRQIQTIDVSTSGTTFSSSAIPSSSLISSTSATSTLSKSTSSSALSNTTTLGPSLASTGYNMVITTVFTQPPECTGGLTEMASATDEIWQNVINPVPSSTLTSCYPSQFYSSAIATASLPPFSQLVCPNNWETYNVNATYVICCPNGFGFYAPNFTNTQRPGLNAICTSSIWQNVLMDITSYDSTALATVIPMTAGVNGTLVFATAFDGIQATSVATSSTAISSSTNTKVPLTSTILPSTSTILPSTSTKVSSATTKASSTTTKASSTTTKASSARTKASPTSTNIASTGTKALSSSNSAKSSTITTSAIASATPTSISQLPACGQTCFNNLLGQYSSLGCATPDPSCLCLNVNFGYGIRDCSNGACGTAVASTVIAFEGVYCASATASHTTSAHPSSIASGIAALPSCGQTCFSNMLGQYSSLGCATPDPSCLCRNVNFGYGIRDCSNGACGTAVASTVIAFESTYCASAIASHTTYPTSTATGIAALPSCGQTCFNNMLGQYSSLGCATPNPACLCRNVNFGYGIRDCSNGACGNAVASTVIAFGSAYCASATATPTGK